MTEPVEQNELLALFAALCEGTISPEQGERLAETLCNDPAARLFYVRYMDIHASLSTASESADAYGIDSSFPASSQRRLAAAQAPSSFGQLRCQVDAGGRDDSSLSGVTFDSTPSNSLSPVRQVTHAVRTAGRRQSLADSDTRPGAAWRSKRRYVAVFVSACFAIILGVSIVRYIEPAPEIAGKQPEVVAVLHAGLGCQWAGPQQPLAPGGRLFAGQRFNLSAGVAKLKFCSGATVLLESPSTFELVSPTALKLESGTVAVRAAGLVKKFLIISPGATIVDLGTSFGVHCEKDGATEVEVFEGAVEIRSKQGSKKSQILKLGESARVDQNGENADIDRGTSDPGRFADLLQMLWEDMRADAAPTDDKEGDGVVKAEFSDAPVAGRIDTFYGAAVGQGWHTPWMAHGNPLGEIRRDRSLSGEDNQYLCTRFYRSYVRIIAREYGACGKFDPARPHVISWRWRYEGTMDGFGDSFDNRVVFYANPYFRHGSWPDNSWLLGVIGADETRNLHRQVYPMQWFVFDGAHGDSFERGNMVNTGMTLKPDVVYRFAVVVYPKRAKYDVAIQDDQGTYTRTGLTFRNKSTVPANMLHFGVNTNERTSDAAFSLDSLRIESLEDTALSPKEQMPTGEELEGADPPSSDDASTSSR